MFTWRSKSPGIANKILKEKNRLGGVILPDFKIYAAIVIKMLWN